MASFIWVPARNLVSRAFRDPKFVRKAPFPYLMRNYNPVWQFLDKTTLRWDENTKLIVLEGPQSPEKTDLAKTLAHEFGMVHMASPSVDEFFYRTQDNKDFRLFNEHFMIRNRPYAEPEFFANPFGYYHGATDRYLFLDYVVKFTNYVFALRHMFNTGEGVIVEGNPFSAYINFEAALRSNYLEPSTHNYFKYAVKIKHKTLLRPNVIVHLDVDTKKASDLLKKKYGDGTIPIQKPVWNNLNYLSDLSTSLKRDYLNEAKKHSMVLVYDWNEPGEHEIIVEDIERLNLDWYNFGDTQQKDWNLQAEEEYEKIRRKVTNFHKLAHLLNFRTVTDSVDAEHIFISAEEAINVDKVFDALNSERFAQGWNPYVGGNPFFKNSVGAMYIKPRVYRKLEYGHAHSEDFVFPEVSESK